MNVAVVVAGFGLQDARWRVAADLQTLCESLIGRYHADLSNNQGTCHLDYSCGGAPQTSLELVRCSEKASSHEQQRN